MKKTMILLLAASLFTASVPALALAHNQQHNAQCEKDCEMQVRNCANEVESLPQRIQKLQSAIDNKANNYSREHLSQLKTNLEDAQRMLATLENAGA